MNDKKRDEISDIFLIEIKKIFKDNLCFAFIFGSVAKRKENPESDIDMFVCTKKESTTLQKKQFNEFYMKMHEDYGFCPDLEYPGEIVSLKFLEKSISDLEKWIPHPQIKTYREFESVFWTAVLAESKIAVIQPVNNILGILENKCIQLVWKWKVFVKNDMKKTNAQDYSLLEVLEQEGYQFLEQHRP